MSFVKPTDPKAFVDWIGVTETLEHAATGHVRTVMLLHQDGSLLAIGHGQSQSTGLSVSQLTASQQYTRFNNDSVTSSLIASMWNDYQDFAGGAQHLSTFNIEFENGQVAVTSIGQLLLCFVASHQIQPGMLRGKMMTIAHTLSELSQIYEPSPQQ